MGRLLLVEEVAELLRCKPDNVRQLVAEARLKAVRLRPKGRLMFREDDVQAALHTAGRRPVSEKSE